MYNGPASTLYGKGSKADAFTNTRATLLLTALIVSMALFAFVAQAGLFLVTSSGRS
jgi:uncharacterized membrane protein YkvI